MGTLRADARQPRWNHSYLGTSGKFEHEGIMRLVEAKIGEVVRVVSFKGRKMNAKLLQVGLYPGDQLKVLREAPLGGPLLVSVGGREMALGRGVADKIIVELD